MPFQRERSDGGASSHRAQDDSGSPTRSTLALDSQGDTLSPLRSHKDESQTRSSRSPLSTKFGPGSWIARVHSSWRHNEGDGNTSEVVRAVEEEDDPTVDWEKVLRELQVEKKRAAAKKNQKYINRSCYLFESNTPFRESVINLVEWHWFDRIVLFLILANCCFLVLDDPVCRCSSDWSSSGCSAHEEYKRILFSWDCSGWPRIQTLLDVSEIIFTVLFTFEMLIKIVARGFILHKHAFLRDGWNWIDFIVVVTSLISQIPSLQTNLQMLRTVRVLRPLRTMTRIKGMTPLVNTFLRSFKALGNVILLLFFFFCVFGILGIELLTGALRGRCYIDPTQEFASAAVRSALESQQFPYIAEPGNNVGGWNGNVGLCSAVGSGGAKCDPVAIDGVEYATVCSNKKWCHTDWCANDWNDNPFDFGGGTFSYDNFAASWLVIFQTLTVEGWVDILYSYEDGFQKWGSRVFHTAWVLIGTFFVVQLALAVLANSFVLALEEERIHKAREAMDEDSLLRPTRAMARRFTMFKSQERSTSLARGLESAGKSMQSSFFASFNWTSFMGGNHNSSTEGKKKQPSALALWGEHNLWGPGTTGNRCYHTVRRSCRILVRSEYFSNTIIVAIVINTLCLALDYHDQARYESDICRRRCELDPDIPAGLSDRCIGPLFNRTFDSDGLGGGRRPLQAYDNFCFMDDDRATGIRGGALECGGIESAEECWAAGGRNACWWFGGSNVPCKRGLYSAKSFSETPNGALNLRHICGDLLDQCQNFAPERQLVFERINTILTFVFISEMVVKMVGLGFLEYFDDQFNQFDFFVVMASIFELIVNTLDSSSSSGSTISALRGMRLFRLFKLARSWKSMRKILKTLGIAIRSLGPLTIIWVMFMYIFALLGMQYFGGNFRQIKTEAPRSNFDSFFPSQLGHGAFLVTFQIITSENWNTIAYNSIGAAGSPLGALPSILIVLFGNYIIMNLFISILLQGFADDGFDQDGNESSFVEGGPRSLKGLKLSAADLYRRMLGRASRQISIDASALMRQHSQQVFRRASDGLKALSETGSRRSSAMSYSGPGTGGAKITGLDAEERREVLERTTVALKERAEETSPQRQRQEGQAEVMQGGSQLSVASVRERDRAGSTPPAKLKPAEAGVRRALPSSEEDDAKAQQEVTASGQGFGTEEDEGAGAGGGAAEDAMSESVSGATVAVSATPSLRVDTPVRAFGDGVSGDEGQGASEASEEKDAKKGDKSPHSAVSAPHIRRLSKPGVDEFPPSSPTAAAAGPTVPLPSPKPSGTTKSVRMADLASTSQRQILDFESQGLPGAVQDPRSERPVRQVSDLVSATPNSPLANAVRCDLPKPAGNDRTVRFPAEEQPAGAKKGAGGAGGGEGGGPAGGKMSFSQAFMADVGLQDPSCVSVTWLGRTFAVAKHNSFFVLAPTNVFRKTVARVVSSGAFDNCILFCILFTSVTLIVEAPDDTIIADACPVAPAFLDCSGLDPGQTEQVNCPRTADGVGLNKVWAACGGEGEAPCCVTQRKMFVLQTLDLIFTCIFTVEMLLKMIVDGLVLHHKAYLRDSWNILDMVIVVIAWVTSFADLGGVAQSIKSLRAIRALRPLRVIKRNPGLRIAVVCLLSSLPSVFGVAVVVVLWFSMYAMLGVQFFKGELYRCYDLENQMFFGAPFDPLGNFFNQPQPLSGEFSVPTIVECVARTGGRGSWEGRDYSFDSYPRALLTLFEMATTEGWMSVMAAVVDGVAPGVSPIPNHKPWYSIFCVVHLIIGAFVLLNLIVGSIINNYNRIKNLGDGGSPLLTREQQDWIDTQKLVSQLKPKSRKVGPKHWLRASAYKIVIHPWFDVVITACIVGNMLAMMTRTHDNGPCYVAVMFYINLFFTTVFVSEAVVKLLGLGPRWYFTDGWNRFDITVTVLSVVMTGIDASDGSYLCKKVVNDGIPSLQILRTFRIARLFRLIRRAKGLKQMIQTLIISLPALANIGALIMLFITIFAVLGTSAFYNTNLEQDLYGFLDANGNYRTFDNALWILFRQTTGEAWNGIMYYCFQSDPYKACDKRYGAYLGDGCGGPYTGVVFHLVWQLFGTYVLMQLFTAVILENFDDLAKEDMGLVPIDKLHQFVDVWTEFDPHAREKIASDRLPALIGSLLPPLGVKSESDAPHAHGPTRTDLMLVIKDLPIPIVNGSIRYKDTFLGCVKRVIALELNHKEDDYSDEWEFQMGQRPVSLGAGRSSSVQSASASGKRAPSVTSAKRSPRSPPGAVGSSPMFRGRPPTVAEDYAARIVQLAFREYKEQRLQVGKAMQRTRLIPLRPHDEGVVITW